MQQQQQLQNPIFIRGEVFNHGVYPTPPKLSLVNIIQLFQNLNLLSNIENKISLDHFRENVAKFIPSMNQKDAEIYFLNYKLMVEDDTTFIINAMKNNANQTIANPQQSILMEKQLLADVRGLSIYFFLQLFSISSRFHQNLEVKREGLNSQFNEGFRQNFNNQFNSSPLNSPRSKATRVQTQFQNEQEQELSFIKNNLKTILQLILNDMNSEQYYFTQSEFNILQLLFKIPTQISQKYSLFQYSQLFQQPGQRVNNQQLFNYINQNLSEQESESGGILTIQGLTKSVMTKDQEQCLYKDIRIQNCEDSFIYIDASVLQISITNCANTTIFVAAVQKVASIQKCENVQITVSANFLRIGNTIDSTIYYYGSYPPVIFGDCRSIQFAPSNVNYVQYLSRLQQAKIPLMYKSSQNFESPITLLKNPNINFSLQKPEDFVPLILPQKFQPVSHSHVQTFEQILNTNFKQILQQEEMSNQKTNIIIPILAPNNYRECVFDRYKNHNEFQQMIKKSGLDEEQQRHLHSAIQGYFKDWLVTSGQIKPISDLVKLIDQE